MKKTVQQAAISAIFYEAMRPEYAQEEIDAVRASEAYNTLDPIRLTDEQLSAKISRAIRLCAAASIEIESAFQGY